MRIMFFLFRIMYGIGPVQFKKLLTIAVTYTFQQRLCHRPQGHNIHPCRLCNAGARGPERGATKYVNA